MKITYQPYNQYLQAQTFETYRPKLKKWVLAIGSTLILGCLVTPGTNLLIPSIMKGVWKYG